MRPYELEVRCLCDQLGLPMPVAEHRLTPSRRWRLDWAWVDDRIAIEIEGGLYGKGRRCPVCKQLPRHGHMGLERALSDLDKYSYASAAGWRLVRRTPDGLLTDLTRAMIATAMGKATVAQLDASIKKPPPQPKLRRGLRGARVRRAR